VQKALIDTNGLWSPTLKIDFNQPGYISNGGATAGVFKFGTSVGGIDGTIIAGNVGIGSTTPSGLLSLQKAGVAELNFLNSSNSVGGFVKADTGAFQIGSNTSHRTDILANNTTGLTVAVGGNVGIGTTAPTQALEVNGFILVNKNIGSGAAAVNTRYLINGNGQLGITNQYGFYDGGTFVLSSAATEVMSFRALHTVNTASGNLTNDYGINIGASSNTGGGTVANAYGVYINQPTIGSTANYALYSVGGTNYFGGNVGIGTTGPSSLLTVAGNIQALTSNDSSGSNRGITIEPVITSASTPQIIRGWGNATGIELQAINTIQGVNQSSVYINPSYIALKTSNTNSVAGVERLRIDGTGNVGIGTITPTSTLFVQGTSTINPFVVASSTGTQLITVLPSGNVGIGTTTPQDKLVVVGRTDLVSAPFNAIPLGLYYNGRSGGYYLSVTDSNDPDLRFLNSGGGSVVTFNNLGNVGIGTTSPATNLHVESSGGGIIRVSRSSVGTGYLQMEADGTNGTLTSLNSILFQAGGSEKVRITSDGNVGIGTTSPTSSLHILGAGITGLQVFTTGTEIRQLWGTGTSTSRIILNHDGTLGQFGTMSGGGNLALQAGGNIYQTITTTGNVGIGTTSPSKPLHVYNAAGNEQLAIGDSSGYSTFQHSSNLYINSGSGGTAGGDTIFRTGTGFTTIMTLKSGGNVGIGTTSPTTLLQLSGGASNPAVLSVDAVSGQDTSLRLDTAGSEKFKIGLAIGTDNAVTGTTLGDVYLRSYGDMIFSANQGTTGHLAILNGGNVGIGTTTPASALVLQSNNGMTIVNTSSTAATSTINLGVAGSNGRPVIDIGPAGTSNEFRIINNGMWRVGTTNNTDISLWTNSADRLYITGGGNVGIGTTTPGHPLVMASGAHVTTGGTWTNASDINLKENFKDLDASEILNKIVAMPIKQWNYKSEDPSIAHIGPFAQDFYEAFSLGGSNTSISTIDPAGVALVGIQALNEKINSLSYSAKATKDILQNSAGNLQNSGNDLSSTTAIKLQSHLYLSEDSVGQAKILLGAKQVRVKFAKAYEFQPIVTLTPASNVQSNYWVAETDATGFTIMLETGERQDVVFNWHAFASEGAKLTVSDGTTSSITLILPQAEVSASGEGSGGEAETNNQELITTNNNEDNTTDNSVASDEQVNSAPLADTVSGETLAGEVAGVSVENSANPVVEEPTLP
jgi:hypothetical protein